jgi:hypothetical protein
MLIKKRRRPYLGAAIIITMIAGLASRKYPSLFPSALGKYPGDALWAQMAYWCTGFVFPSASTGRIALYALTASYADELSQLYQAPWINAIRSTAAGHLVLGSFFSWLDIVAYTIGIALCVIIESFLLNKKNPDDMPAL